MTLKRMIDADKICANLLFLRNLRPLFIVVVFELTFHLTEESLP